MATRTWLGNAQDIKQVDTVTIALTWATADSVTLTINGISMVVTVGSLTTTAQVATTIQEAWQSATTFTDTTATVSPAGGGTAIPEFEDITAEVSGSVVTLTGDTAGRPFTLSVTETTAGDGTATEATPTAATGKHFWDNVDNWSATTVPIDNDTVVFDSGNVDLRYNLTTAIQPAAVIRTNGYEGRIGNGEVNKDNADPDFYYNEYRGKYLTFDNNTVTTTYTIGEEAGAGSGRTRIDAGAGQVILNVSGSGTRTETGEPAITFLGTHASNEVNVFKGDLGIAFYEAESATVATLRVGQVDNELGDAVVNAGSGATLTTVTAVGGQSTLSAATTTLNQTGGEVILLAGAHATVNCDSGGKLSYRSTGTITTLKVGEAHFDNSANIRGATITNVVQLYKGAQFSDPNGSLTLTAGLKINRARLADVTLDLGVDKTYTSA